MPIIIKNIENSQSGELVKDLKLVGKYRVRLASGKLVEWYKGECNLVHNGSVIHWPDVEDVLAASGF
jgi:hypothetical protein